MEAYLNPSQATQTPEDWCSPKLYTKSIPANRNTINVNYKNQSVNPVLWKLHEVH